MVWQIRCRCAALALVEGQLRYLDEKQAHVSRERECCVIYANSPKTILVMLNDLY